LKPNNMSFVGIHDKIQKFVNKKLKVDTSRLISLVTNSWEKAKKEAKKISLFPGWAVYFIRDEGYVDHIAIVINQENGLLNLSEAILLHAAPSPIGTGVGPLTNKTSDKSGLRIATALEFIELHQPGYYKKIFVGPPPNTENSLLIQAGKIAEDIAKSGLVDGKPVVYSFYNVPLINKFFVYFFDPLNKKVKIQSLKKIKQAFTSFYCGPLVGEIWRRAGITNIPEVGFLKMRGPTSFSLFKWSKNNKTIINGLTWNI